VSKKRKINMIEESKNQTEEETPKEETEKVEETEETAEPEECEECSGKE